MRVKSIFVGNLFGYLNHEINFSKEEPITMIHGPNGCGKTTILELLDAVFAFQYHRIERIIFDVIKIKFSDNSLLNIKKTEDVKVVKTIRNHNIKRSINLLNFTYSKRGIKKKEFTPQSALSHKDFRFPVSIIEHEIPWLERIGPEEWADSREQDVCTLEDVFIRYSDVIPFPTPTIQKPDWLVKILGNINVHFIKSERLIRTTSIKRELRRERILDSSNMIEVYAKELGKIISNKLAESVAIAQGLDRSFPNRLLSSQTGGEKEESFLREWYTDIENKRNKLMYAGLLGEEPGVPLPEDKMDPTEKRVMTLYLQDTEKKLNVFDELQTKIEAFMDIINTKIKDTKALNVDPKLGFYLISVVNEGEKLKLSKLSSGEQHQIVLFYELIFKTKKNTLVLIDEPEISLHVEWQRLFLKDLMTIGAISDLTFLIATHSPQIVHDRWDLAVGLSGGIQK